MKKVLIQLIGGQPLPNIFSLLSVVPDEVVNIFTKETQEQHEDIIEWYKKFGNLFGLALMFREYKPVSRHFSELPGDLYGILSEEARRADEDTLLMLNMTGGTKPMAAWSMNICMRLERENPHLRIPIFYVDTQERSFDFFAHREMREQVLTYAPFSRRLSVKQIAESRKLTQLRSCHTDWHQAYPAAHLLQQQFADIEMGEFEVKKLQELAQTPLSEQGKGPDMCEKIKSFAVMVGEDPAVQKALRPCGLQWKEGDIYFDCKLRSEIRHIVKKAEQNGKKPFFPHALSDKFQSARNFLVAGWWEVLVAHAYQLQHPEAEVLWSVETAAPSGKPVETDVIATDGLSLTCISCKRSKHQGYTQELEQHCNRTELLGGVLHQRIIAVYHPNKDVDKLASALRMKVWTRKTVEDIINATEEPAVNEPTNEESADETHIIEPATSDLPVRCQPHVLDLIEKDLARMAAKSRDKERPARLQTPPCCDTVQTTPATPAEAEPQPATTEQGTRAPEKTDSRSFISRLWRAWSIPAKRP